MSAIRGENVKSGAKGVMIGRPSPLGNPFVIGRDGTRAEVIAKYRVWLWAQIKARGKAYEALVALKERSRTEEITLLCYCKPLACHGDVVKAALEWME